MGKRIHHVLINVSGAITVDVTDEDIRGVMEQDPDFEDERHAASFFARESAHTILQGIRSRDVDLTGVEFNETEVHIDVQ